MPAAELALADDGSRAHKHIQRVGHTGSSSWLGVPSAPSTDPTSKRLPRGPGALPAEVVVLMTAGRGLDRLSVHGILAGLRLSRRGPRTCTSEVPRREPGPRPVGTGGLGCARQRPRRRACGQGVPPGGWQLVGRSGFPFFTAERPSYVVLDPGDRVRVPRRRCRRCRRPAGRCGRRRGSPPRGRGPARAPGRGVRARGAGSRMAAAAPWPPSRIPAAYERANPVSFALANRLVGNGGSPPGPSGFTGGGTRLRCRGEGGARRCRGCSARGPRGRRRSSGPGRALPSAGGGAPGGGALRAPGCRTYLSVSGAAGG